jgi:hypothetical protein
MGFAGLVNPAHPASGLGLCAIGKDGNSGKPGPHLGEHLMRPDVLSGKYGESNHDEQNTLHEGEKKADDAQHNKQPARDNGQRLFHAAIHTVPQYDARRVCKSDGRLRLNDFCGLADGTSATKSGSGLKPPALPAD